MSSETGDVDIDFANRQAALAVLEHIPASIIKSNKIEKHNTGVYFHAMPLDPITGLSSISYDNPFIASKYKIDLLNVNIYKDIKDEAHLLSLMERELDFSLFENVKFTEKLIHLSNHASLVAELKPQNLSHLAIILALIRPAKKHLIKKALKMGLDSVEPEIWINLNDENFSFKKSHSVGYAMLIKVHANLICEQSA